MIYARGHDRTAAEDYYAAMAQIKKSLDLTTGQAPGAKRDDADVAMSASERAQLLELLSRLANPHLDYEAHLDLLEQMHQIFGYAGNPPPLSISRMVVAPHRFSSHNNTCRGKGNNCSVPW